MIRLSHLGLPPTSNHAYINLPHGGRRLSAEGERYKNEVKVYLAREYRRELLLFRKDAPYLVLLRFHLEAVQNKGYPVQAKSRYKKIDTTNRIKLLEDVLKDVTGVDDSNNMTAIVQKVQGSPERVDIWFWDLENEMSPFDDQLRSLT